MMFARTRRLLLRPRWSEDDRTVALAMPNDAIHSGWDRSLFGGPGHAATDDESHELLMMLRTDGSPMLVGGIGVAPSGVGTHLTFWVSEDHRNNGLATEAGQAMLGIASHALGIRNLSAAVPEGNQAAARVLEKLEFTVSGRTVRRVSDRDSLVPAAVFSRTLGNRAGILAPALAA